MKDQIWVNQAGCLDTCAMGPSGVACPEGVGYTVKTDSDVNEIVEQHFIGGKPVKRLIQIT